RRPQRWSVSAASPDGASDRLLGGAPLAQIYLAATPPHRAPYRGVRGRSREQDVEDEKGQREQRPGPPAERAGPTQHRPQLPGDPYPGGRPHGRVTVAEEASSRQGFEQGKGCSDGDDVVGA